MGEEDMAEETVEEFKAESAQILANEARDRLQSRGFSDTRIRELAEAYVAEEAASVDLEDFVDWVTFQRP